MRSRDRWHRRQSPHVLWLSLALLIGFVTGLSRVPIPTITAMAPGADREAAEWPTADGVGGTHYSHLSGITASNVRHLERAWVHRTGDGRAHEEGVAGTAFEATPVMVDGLLYVSTPFSRVLAMDAETGEEVWAFDAEIDRTDTHHTMVTSRGIAVWTDPTSISGDTCARRLFLAAYDARLFALDALTGRRCEDFAQGGVFDLGRGVPRIEGRRNQYKQTAHPRWRGPGGRGLVDLR